MRNFETDKKWDELNRALHKRQATEARKAADVLLADEHQEYLVDTTWTSKELASRWELDRHQQEQLRPLAVRLDMINHHVDYNWDRVAYRPDDKARVLADLQHARALSVELSARQAQSARGRERPQRERTVTTANRDGDRIASHSAIRRTRPAQPLRARAESRADPQRQRPTERDLSDDSGITR